ncbi:MAG: methionine--tRNA ligase [Candidatus Staskawiczbacteria bacterium]|nr:methionine--tRNA ligase [Candidatus Staskawiczbacteria bacterium]
MDIITFDEFKKVDIRIGKIISTERVEGSDKLLKLQVDFGEEKRQVIAGIGKVYEPESLIGKECPFAFNLEPRSLKGLESQGMILCASAPLSTGPSDSGNPASAGSSGVARPVLLCPDKEIPPGSIVK